MSGSLARATAEAYVDAVNAVDLDGLLALFADGAVLDHALGTFEGSAAIRAFYAENVLEEQPFVRDESQTVGALAKSGGMKVKRFIRWQLGEEPATAS